MIMLIWYYIGNILTLICNKKEKISCKMNYCNILQYHSRVEILNFQVFQLVPFKELRKQTLLGTKKMLTLIIQIIHILY